MIYQTGMLPNTQSLINFSTYLTHTRAPLEPPVPFPGTPSSSDLSVLHSPIPTGTLTESDIHDLKKLYNDLVQICTHAANRGVRVLIDAEQRCVSSSIASMPFPKVSNPLSFFFKLYALNHVFCNGLSSQTKLSLPVIVGTNLLSTHLDTH